MVVSTVSVMPKPGDRPLAGPLRWSVRTKTSGRNFKRTPLAASTMRFVIVGDVLSA